MSATHGLGPLTALLHETKEYQTGLSPGSCHQNPVRRFTTINSAAASEAKTSTTEGMHEVR